MKFTWLFKDKQWVCTLDVTQAEVEDAGNISSVLTVVN